MAAIQIGQKKCNNVICMLVPCLNDTANHQTTRPNPNHNLMDEWTGCREPAYVI